MKSSTTLPLICGFVLTAVSVAGLSHWWSVRQFIGVMNVPLPHVDGPRLDPVPAAPSRKSPDSPVLGTREPVAKDPVPSFAQKQFYEALITKMEGIQSQNRDLLDQLAETNRDLMKLEFRVDTHSESFRPMPVREDRPFTSVDDESGVLPPRAKPVVFPNDAQGQSFKQ